MSLATQLTPDDTFLAMFALAGGNFDIDPYEIQERFYGSRDNHLLSEFVFSETGPLPYSPVLEKSMQRLSAGGFITRRDIQNPDRIEITKSGEEYFHKEILPNLSLADKLSLNELSNYLFVL